MEHIVIGRVLGPECLALPLGAVDGGLRHRVEIHPAVEVRVSEHVNAAPQRGFIARGVPPGAAHLPGPQEDLDVVELAEDGRYRVQRQRRPVPRLLGLVLLPAAASIAAAAAAPRGG